MNDYLPPFDLATDVNICCLQLHKGNSFLKIILYFYKITIIDYTQQMQNLILYLLMCLLR